MILLWGLPGDDPLAMVYQALQRQGAPVLLLDQRLVLQTGVELAAGPGVSGWLSIGGQKIDLSAVSAVYLRPYDSRQIPSVQRAGPGSPEWQHALLVDDILTSWIELTPALVVNRPSAMATNNSKPYQARWCQEAGFAIPDTLLTTSPAEVRAFRAQHSDVIYKSISGVRSIVCRLTEDQVERLDKVVWCPTQFQQYVPGDDYRVHVIGDDVFACHILSAADDYRYATRQGATTTIQACTLPEEIVARCRTLAASLYLPVAGIDLRRTPDGCWYCFEVNPSPGFTYFQEAADQPIDEAIARLLIEGRGLPGPDASHPAPASLSLSHLATTARFRLLPGGLQPGVPAAE